MPDYSRGTATKPRSEEQERLFWEARRQLTERTKASGHEYTYDQCLALAQRLAWQEWYEVTAPWRRIKERVYNMAIPKIIYDSTSGPVTAECEFSPQEKEILAAADAVIAEIGMKYGVVCPMPSVSESDG